MLFKVFICFHLRFFLYLQSLLDSALSPQWFFYFNYTYRINKKINYEHERNIINCKLLYNNCICSVLTLIKFWWRKLCGNICRYLFANRLLWISINSTVVSTSKAASLHEQEITCKTDNMQLLGILGWLFSLLLLLHF